MAAARALASPAFDVVPFSGRYRALGNRLKLDFSAITFALDHIPLNLRGEDHAAQRAEAARLIAEARPGLAAALPGIVARRFGCLAVPGQHELMREAVIPAIDDMTEVLAGLAPGLAADSMISRVFSQKIGVAQRRRMEAELAALIGRVRAAFPGDDEARIGVRLALIVLGRDATIGTLARSLAAFFGALDGRPLSAAALPVPPTHTGVPYIDRECVAETTLDGRTFAGGEVLRCRLSGLEGGGDPDRQRFFGMGAHVCLGRSVALDLFGALRDHLAGLETRVRVTEHAMRDCDVFVLPERMTVEVR